MPEQGYEWGNKENNLIKPEEVAQLGLAAAAMKWRREEGGAFKGMKFIVIGPNKEGSVKR